MAWTENDKQKIRFYLGASAIYRNWYSILDSAIKAVQSIADGGNMPDGSVETAMRSILTRLDNLQTQLDTFAGNVLMVGAADDAKLDAARALVAGRQQGRMLANQLGTYLDFSPVRDVFSAATGGPHGPALDPLRVGN